MGKLEFARRFVCVNSKPISFDGRPYLPAIYSTRRNVVLRCSRQTEKSTFLANTIIYEACVRPGIQMLFVCPRLEQARMFSRTRLLKGIEQSPLVARRLTGHQRKQVMNLHFNNGSSLFIRAAYHSGDACRGISAQLLLVDEFQDIAEGDLPVLQEVLSHATDGRTILTGTPKHVDNHLEGVFRRSTANEWTIHCTGCSKHVILDDRSLSPLGLACRECGSPIDPNHGHWVPRNPNATWGDGYWINHLMVPWLSIDEVLDRQRTYDIPRFKNEVLGLPTTTGDCVVSRDELEACCAPTPMARSSADIPARFHSRLTAGIDWGGGGRSRTVLVVGYMADDYRFQVVRFERFAADEEPRRILDELATRCRQLGVQWIAADGGGHGHVFNRLLYDRFQGRGLFAVLYSASDQEPRRDGVLMKWTVDRSAAIGVLISRIKNLQLVFPPVQESGNFLDEFACEIAEYDDINRRVKYTHPESQMDDALHATNYALLVATRAYQVARQHG